MSVEEFDFADLEGFLDCGNWSLYGKDWEGFPHEPQAVRVCFSLEVDSDDIFCSLSKRRLEEWVIEMVTESVTDWACYYNFKVKKRKRIRKKCDYGFLAKFGSWCLDEKVTGLLEDVGLLNVFFCVEVPDGDNDGMETLKELSGAIIDNMEFCYYEYEQGLIGAKSNDRTHHS